MWIEPSLKMAGKKWNFLLKILYNKYKANLDKEIEFQSVKNFVKHFGSHSILYVLAFKLEALAEFKDFMSLDVEFFI